MNIEKLFDLINKSWNAEKASFSLDMAVLESASVKRLYQWFLPSSQIQFEGVSKPELVDEEGVKKVKIEKAIYPKEFLKLSSPAVSAEFWIKDEEVQLLYSFTSTITGFKLSEVFPELETYQIDALTYKTPGFTITTTPNDTVLDKLQNRVADLYYDDALDKTLKRGLIFNGIVQMPEEMQWLLDLFKVEEITVNGPVQIFDNNLPRLLLTAKQDKGFDILDKVTLELSFQMVALYSIMEGEQEGEYEKALDTFYRFSAKFNYLLENNQKLELPISATFYGTNPQEVTFELDAIGVTAYGLNQLAGIVNQSSLVKWTEGLQGFPSTQAMLVNKLSVSVSLDDGISLTNIEMVLDFKAEEVETVGYELVPNMLTIKSFLLVFGVNNPLDNKNRFLYASMEGSISMPNSELTGEIYGKVSLPQPRFEVGLTEYSFINITGLLNRLFEQAQLPKLEIPVIECDELQISGGIKPIALNFNTSLQSEEGLDIGGLFKLKQLGFAFAYTEKGIKEGTVIMGAGLQVGKHYLVNLSGGLSEGNWVFKGSFKAEEGHPLSLKDFLPEGVEIPDDFLKVAIKGAEINLNLTKKSFSFILDGEVSVEFEGVGKVACKKLSVSVAKREKEDGLDWKVSSKGFIELLKIDWTGNGDDKPLIDLGGELILTNAPQPSISFKADADKNVIKNIPVLIPYKVSEKGIEWSLMDFHFDSIKLGKDQDKKWSFSADFTLKVTQIIKEISQFLPEDGFKTELKIGNKSASVKLKEGFFDIKIPKFVIPKVPNSDFGPFDIGAAQLSFKNLELKIEKRISASVDICFYLPENFNTLLGKKEDETPQWDLFYTYPSKEQYLGITLKAEISDKPGVSASLTNIPIKTNFLKPYKGETELEGEKDKWQLHLGKDGEFLDLVFTFPVFKLDMSKGGFECDVFFELKKSPAMPFGFAKQFLKNAGQKEIAEKLPDKVKIPLLKEDLPQIITNESKMDLNELNKFLGYSLPPKVIEELKPFEEIANRLPKAFIDYLKFEPITDLKLSIKVTPTGNVDVNFSSKSGLKMLFFTPPFRIQGIYLREFSFGALFGGALFSTSIDADFDDFDIVSLCLAAAFSDNPEVKKYIGDPREYHSKLALHKLLVIIVYQTQIPIPIPLFYDKVGIDYYGLGGVKMTAGAAFTAEQLDLLKTVKFFGEVVNFLTKEDKRLDSTVNPGIDFKFKLNPSYIQLPKWAGEKKYGLVNGIDFDSAYQLVANLLNGIKFFDLNDTVSSLPVSQRALKGKVEFDFVCVQEIEGGSIITTVPKFIGGEYDAMGVSKGEADELLKMLPGNVSQDKKAVVSFIRGKWKAPIGGDELKFSFGAISNGIKQFGFATTMSGKIADIFEGKFDTTIGISASNTPFLAKGKGSLKILNIPIYDGEYEVKVENKNFGLEGAVDLFDERFPFFFKGKASGHIDGENLRLSGSITKARLLVFETSGHVSVSNTGVSAGIFGSTFSIGVEGNELKINGDLNIPLTTYSTAISIRTDNWASLKLTSNTIKGLFNTSISYTGNVLNFSNNLEFSLTLLGIPAFNGGLVMRGDYFSVKGSLNLALGPFKFFGEINGEIRLDGFSIGSDITIRVDGLDDFKGDITISDKGIRGSVTIAKIKHEFYILEDRGCIKVKVGLLPEVRICTFTSAAHTAEVLFDDKQLTVYEAILVESLPQPNGQTGVLYAKGYPNSSVLIQLLVEHLIQFTLAIYSGDEGRMRNYENMEVATEKLSAAFEKEGANTKLILKGKAGVHGKRFFEELKEYVDKKLEENGRNETLDVSDATYAMDVINDGAATKSKISLDFPNATEKMRHAVYEFEGIMPHYTMFGKIALQMMKE